MKIIEKTFYKFERWKKKKFRNEKQSISEVLETKKVVTYIIITVHRRNYNPEYFQHDY